MFRFQLFLMQFKRYSDLHTVNEFKFRSFNFNGFYSRHDWNNLWLVSGRENEGALVGETVNVVSVLPFWNVNQFELSLQTNITTFLLINKYKISLFILYIDENINFQTPNSIATEFSSLEIEISVHRYFRFVCTNFQ